MDFHTPWHTKLVPFTLRSPCVSRSRDHLLGRCGWWCSRGGTADHTHGTPAASQGEGALSWEWMRVVILCQWFIGLHASVDTFQLKTCKGWGVVFIPWLTEVYHPPSCLRVLTTSDVEDFWMVWLRGLIHPKFGELCPKFGWNTWAQQGDASIGFKSQSQGMRLFEHRFFRAFTVGLGQSLFGAFGKRLRRGVGWETFYDFLFFGEANGEPLGLWSIGKLTETMNWVIDIHWLLEILHHTEEIERIWFFASKWQQWMSCRPTRPMHRSQFP